MEEPGIRSAERLKREVLVRLTAVHQEQFSFEGVAVGLSVHGMGLRSSDPVLNCATLQMLMRDAFKVMFQIEGVEFSDITCKILRVEKSRKDPTKDYFIAVRFIQISDLDELNLQTYIRFYSSREEEENV
ncbi:MAG: PilZ domain-containing protein [Candidatus Hydrogenedentota bacterium]